LLVIAEGEKVYRRIEKIMSVGQRNIQSKAIREFDLQHLVGFTQSEPPPHPAGNEYFSMMNRVRLRLGHGVSGQCHQQKKEVSFLHRFQFKADTKTGAAAKGFQPYRYPLVCGPWLNNKSTMLKSARKPCLAANT